MSVIICTIFAFIGITLVINSFDYSNSDKKSSILFVIGVILVILCIATIIFTFSMQMKIAERGAVATSEHINTYELVSLQRDTEIFGHGTRFYLEVSEKTVFHFYYKTIKNGKEGFAPKTITSNDVFIDETYECEPVILEIITTYEYQFTEFEKWWLNNYSPNITPYTQTCYEIYVPAGSIVESYELK